MTTWDSATARTLTAPQEITISVEKSDGTFGKPRIIWIVRNGDDVYIRSTNGRAAAWFRGAVASGRAQIHSGGATYDVRLVDVEDEDARAAADAGYRAKYSAYASIVAHLVEPEPRAATLAVLPV